MTHLILSLLLATTIQPTVAFHLNPAEQAAATKSHDETALKLAPSAKQKLRRVAQSLAGAPNVESAARLGIANAFPDVDFSNMDISELMIFLMWEASRDAENDMKNMLEEINKINQRKAALRNATDDVGKRKVASLNDAAAMAGLRLQTMTAKDSAAQRRLSSILNAKYQRSMSIIQNLR